MSESYPPPADRSTPAPPDLPERPPPKFQFNLKQLLACMFVSALVAMGIRQLVLLLPNLPGVQQTALVNVFLGALVIAALLYYFVRAPYLAVRAIDANRRWRQIQKHRHALEGWSIKRLNKLDRAIPPQDPSAPD